MDGRFTRRRNSRPQLSGTEDGAEADLSEEHVEAIISTNMMPQYWNGMGEALAFRGANAVAVVVSGFRTEFGGDVVETETAELRV